MKVSDWIAGLERIRAVHGDLDVMVSCEATYLAVQSIEVSAERGEVFVQVPCCSSAGAGKGPDNPWPTKEYETTAPK